MIVSLADGADGVVAAVCLLSFLTGLGPTPDVVFPADEPSPESTPSPPLTGKPQIICQHLQLLHYFSTVCSAKSFYELCLESQSLVIMPGSQSEALMEGIDSFLFDI